MKERKEVDQLVETNFFAKSSKKLEKGISDCGSNCYGCQCPGGEVGGVSAEVIGYAGGYAGDLSVQAGIV
jgi:hypothetical protein